MDTVCIEVPAELAPGTYSMMTGWYNPNTLERLPAFEQSGERAPNDLITLPLKAVVAGG